MEKDFSESFPTLEESKIAIQKLKQYKWPEYNQLDDKDINKFTETVSKCTARKSTCQHVTVNSQQIH